jgi:hypothetical protein
VKGAQHTDVRPSACRAGAQRQTDLVIAHRDTPSRSGFFAAQTGSWPHPALSES